MKKLIILIGLFSCLVSQAQRRIHGDAYFNIRNNSFGWIGAGGTDSLARIDSLKIKLYKPILPGSYTLASAPDATLFPGYIITIPDSAYRHFYSNGTSWLAVGGTGGGGGGSGTVTSVSGTDGSGFDFTITNPTTTPAIALTTSLTTGSVPYIGASGALSQNNANLFWDNSNIRMGIGTATPAERLHIYRDADVLALMQFQNPNAGVSAAAGVKLSTNGGDSYIYRTSNAYVSGLGDDLVFQEPGGGDMVWFTANEKMRLLNSGNFGIGINAPSNMLDILHASQPQLRLTTTATTSYTTLQGVAGNVYIGGSATTNTMIALGGSTSSFGAIQRNGANTRSRLADNSANTDHEVADEAYDATNWNGNVEVPTKNAIRDKIETITGATTIYTGDDTLAGNRTVTMSGNTLNFTGGNVGFSTTGPDRRLDILDAAAAQLRLTHTDGTVYTDAQTDANGVLNITPTGRYISTPTGTTTARGYLPSLIWNELSVVTSSGTTETDLYTFTTRASELSTDGESLEFTVHGYVGDASGTKTLRAYWAGTEVFEAATTSAVVYPYDIKVIVMRTTSTNARIYAKAEGGGFAFTSSGETNPRIVNVTTTFTNTNIIKVTGQSSDGGTYIDVQGGFLKWLPSVLPPL